MGQKKGAYAIAHGATGKGNDQIRFERAVSYLSPELKIIAPWKVWSFKGREDLFQYLLGKGFSYSNEEKIYSEDVNLLHRSCEGGVLEELQQEFNFDEVIKWTRFDCTKKPDLISLTFKHGIPIRLNDKALSPLEIMEELNEVGKKFGLGIVDLVEERFNGIKSRGVYETPGGTILHSLIKCLKHLCWNKTTQKLSRQLADEYAELVYEGKWHSTARRSLEAYFLECSKYLNGTISFSDLHELKKTFFLCYEETVDCLDIFVSLMAEIEIDDKRACLMLDKGHVLATDLANKLVEKGYPFREAYKLTAHEAHKCSTQRKQIHKGSLFCEIDPDYSFEKSVEERNFIGGTALRRVQESISFLRSSLKKK